MLIFAVALILIGLIKKQPRRYWAYALAALVVQSVVGGLMSAYGTLEDPTGDGPLTAFVRSATNDGPWMAAYGLLVIVLAWGVPIYLVTRGYVSPTTDLAGGGSG